MDRPPRPVRGEILRVRVIGLMMVTGGALAWLTVALPPAAMGSDVVVLAIGAVAVVMGLALLATRREVPAAVLGAVVAFSTLLIAVASAEGGNGGTGTSDNEVLYVWVCLVSFYFLSLPHALTQLAIVGVAYAGVLSATEVALDDALTRWTVTVTTLLVAGLLIARLRRGLEHTVFELGQRARLDSLTGLLNRRGLEERAAVEFARVQRDGAPVGMIVADIDGFKAFNDARGHPAGDEVLNTVALALSTQTRELDAVARLGGDEFAVLLPGASLRKAKRVAERIRLAVARSARETGVGISLSVGVAVSPPAGLSLEDLWTTADRAMYVAKRGGGDRVALVGDFEPAAGLRLAAVGVER